MNPGEFRLTVGDVNLMPLVAKKPAAPRLAEALVVLEGDTDSADWACRGTTPKAVTEGVVESTAGPNKTDEAAALTVAEEISVPAAPRITDPDVCLVASTDSAAGELRDTCPTPIRTTEDESAAGAVKFAEP